MRYEATYYNNGWNHMIYEDMTIQEICEYIQRTEPEAKEIEINRK